MPTRRTNDDDHAQLITPATTPNGSPHDLPTPGELTSELLDAPGGSLAAALPESLTITVDLPATVHSVPEHETAVAIDLVSINPGTLLVADDLSTTTISVIPEAHISHPVIEEDAASEPVVIPELPVHDSGYAWRGRSTPRVSTGPVMAQQSAPTQPRARDGRTPESASELTAERLIGKPGRKRRRPAPEGAWPALVYALTLHLVNLGDSWRVRERKQIDARIAKEFEGSTRFVPVLTRKGGVGKTTVTTLIGMAMADVRDDRVIAIDANPDRGTLAERVSKQTRFTVRDVVKRAPTLSDFTDFSTLVSRDETRLDVLASDTDPMLSEAFNEDDYNVVADLAAHFYSIVLTDCGTGIVHSVMRATLQRADSVVIVSGGSVDEARLASETLTWLESNGYSELVKNAVVALNTATQGTNLVKLEEIVAHFQSRVRAIVRIPYDPQLAAGSVIDYKSLKPFTRESARELAALVTDGLPSTRSL
ncbi:MAG: MinD/ParA family ATP-binding protein [Microbacteriaceae bacterium]